jgi:hypothetical protein
LQLNEIFNDSSNGGLRFIIENSEEISNNGHYNVELSCDGGMAAVKIETSRKAYINVEKCEDGIISLITAVFVTTAVLSGLFADGFSNVFNPI